MQVRTVVIASALLGTGLLPLSAQRAEELYGTWRIQRMLPTPNAACWDAKHAQSLLGTTLTYGAHRMRWQGGAYPVSEILSRQVSAEEFRQENSAGGSLDLSDLGVHRQAVTEFDLQHEDADITGATTEVPGDTVLFTGRNTIVVSACGVYFEAVRVSSKTAPTVPPGRSSTTLR